MFNVVDRHGSLISYRIFGRKYVICHFVSQVIAFKFNLQIFFCYRLFSFHTISFCRFFCSACSRGLLTLHLFLTGIQQHWHTLLSFQLFCPRGVRSWDASSSSVTRRTGRTNLQAKCPCSLPWAPWSPASRMGQYSHCCAFWLVCDVCLCARWVCEHTDQALWESPSSPHEAQRSLWISDQTNCRANCL